MNLMKNGVVDNPTVAQLKEEFKHLPIDWSKPIKIGIAERYIKVKNGITDINKKAIEPTYNKNINGQPTQVRYFALETTRNSGGVMVKNYTPGEIYFGKFGCFDFDFSTDDTTSDTSLFWFLMNHPNRGQEFDIKLPEKTSEDWMEKERTELKVRNMFLTKSPNYITDEKLVNLAYQMKVTNPESIGINSLRKMLYESAMANPSEFVRVFGSKTFEVIGLIQQAVDLKVVHYDSGSSTWYYTYAPDSNNILNLQVDTRTPIYRCRPHMAQKPMDDLAWFLSEQDGNGHSGLIQESLKARRLDLANHPDNKLGDTPEKIKKFAARITVNS